jgi:hypothetical protein
MTVYEWIRIVSIFSILIPLFFGWLRWRNLVKGLRYFWVFLLFAFAVDIGIYTWVRTGNNKLASLIYSLYSLAEALVFLAFIRYSSGNLLLKRFVSLMWVLTLLHWLGLMIYSLVNPASNFLISAIFDPVYQVVASFLAGFVLLEIVERNLKPVQTPTFWILLGIFFYCFCTFFILGLVNTILGQKLWWLHNIFNITAYGLYAMGFSLAKKRQNEPG